MRPGLFSPPVKGGSIFKSGANYTYVVDIA